MIKRERERRGEISREIHLLTRKERRLIHWRCSRDPPRMQTQSLQRVTREMIDEGIGEKVAQRGKKKKNTGKRKKNEKKKAKSKENHLKALKHNFSELKHLNRSIENALEGGKALVIGIFIRNLRT